MHMNESWIGFCLNINMQITIVSRSNLFSKTEKKNYYIPEICKNLKTTPLKIHKKHNRWIHFGQIFLCVAETHATFLLFDMFLRCSFTNNALSHGIKKGTKINALQKRCEYHYRMPLSVKSSYIQKWISPGVAKRTTGFVKLNVALTSHNTWNMHCMETTRMSLYVNSGFLCLVNPFKNWFYYMAMPQKDCKQTNSRIWLAKIDLDRGLDQVPI